MTRWLGVILVFSGWLLSAQQPKAGVLSGDEIKKVVPTVYYFRGQSVPVQVRNSAGFSAPDGKLVLAGLVDTSGYASDVPGDGCGSQRSVYRRGQNRRQNAAPGAAENR